MKIIESLSSDLFVIMRGPVTQTSPIHLVMIIPTSLMVPNLMYKMETSFYASFFALVVLILEILVPFSSSL